MDSGLTIRPTASVAETVHARPEVPPVRTAVATTLAPSKSVTAAPESHRTSYDTARNGVADQQTTRQVIIDPQSREVIYRVIDVRTGQVNHQVPDEALLRLKAYVRAEVDRQNRVKDDGATDREV
jgi:hypothetical protein